MRAILRQRLPGAVIAAALLLTIMPAALQGQGPAADRAVHAETLAMIMDHQHPRLVLVLSFDQLRTDYLLRYSDQFLPALGTGGSIGGFAYLMEKGAFLANAHYSHVPTFTGPGHATILTGVGPSGSGIVANDWVTSTGRTVNCVEDLSVKVVGGPMRATSRGRSPVNLRAETVTDVLRMATNRHAKVVGIGIKDRGSILLAGHNPTAAVWFDSGSGNWVTSSYYGDQLPAFAAEANHQRLSERWLGKSWDYLLPKQAYERSAPEKTAGAGAGRGLAPGFPKPLSEPGGNADSAYFDKLIFTPFGNELVFETGKLAIQGEELGRDGYPDILCLAFSTNDLVGHTYGPHSPEVHDLMLRTDRYLSDFLNYVKVSVPGGLDNVLVVLASDHGVAPLPDWARESMKLDADRIDGRVYTNAARQALLSHFAPQIRDSGSTQITERLVHFSEPYIMFNQPVFQELQLDQATAQRVVAEALRKERGVYMTYTRNQIENGQLPPGPIGEAVANGFHPERSGDVLLVSQPFYYPSTSTTGSTHGAAYNYDTHVPVIFAGRTIRPGLYTIRADVRDIAPTLSLLLGIGPPALSQGKILDILK